MADKWYHSDLANKFGIAAIIISAAFGSMYFIKGCSEALTTREKDMVEIKRMKKNINLQLQTGHLNNNTIEDKFYTIDDKTTCVVELDGDSKFYKK